MNYKKHYDKLIERAKFREINCYVERHHIIPKCMGGNNKKENIAMLTAEEHYVAHQLLYKMYPANPKLLLAVKMMSVSGGTVIRNNKMFSWIRKKVSVLMQEIGRPPSQKGVAKTAEHKRKIGNSQKGKLISEESKTKMRESHKGKKGTRNGAILSQETKDKLSNSVKSVKKIECETCLLLCSPGNYKRWHGINCRNKND